LSGGVTHLAATRRRVGLRSQIETAERLAPLASPFTTAVCTGKHQHRHLIADRSSLHRRSPPHWSPSHSPFSLSAGRSAKHSRRAPHSPPLLDRAGRSLSVPRRVPSSTDHRRSPPLLLRAHGITTGAHSYRRARHHAMPSTPPRAPVRTSPLSLAPSLAAIRYQCHCAAVPPCAAARAL
jgi:hypothetical protein